MKENRGAAIIDQLINDIQENDWYCIQNGSECDLHGWEKALIVAGLESLFGSDVEFIDDVEQTGGTERKEREMEK